MFNLVTICPEYPEMLTYIGQLLEIYVIFFYSKLICLKNF